MLQDGYQDSTMETTSVNLSSGLPGGDYCNFKCCYCTYGEGLNTYQREDNVLQILQQVADVLPIEQVSYACGELTVSPFRNEIIELWKRKKWKGRVLTNAAVYCEGLAELLSEGLVSLNCSIDAGTAETFARIKRVNCFDRVIGNIKKYSETGGSVILKYILLEGVNDNEADIEGFIKLTHSINANAIFSRDSRNMGSPMAENEYNMLRLFVKLCGELDTSFSVLTNLMTSDLPRLKSDGLKTES